jgi:RNA polymerase sigma-70 factor (ECF subfamily)
MKLHRSRASYVRGADPLPWIFTIAHRTFLDEARRRKRSRGQIMQGATLPEVSASTEVSAEDNEPYSPELISAVLDALHRLPENQRDALLLTKIQGMRVADAAALLGTTPGALKVRMHRAYVALRGVFEPG